ncbi:hypothetical protein CQZ93_04590 [Ochrobactrum vermis]|nr:hypothetical protein CQZ93_04590 [Ochrobactrum vermis]
MQKSAFGIFLAFFYRLINASADRQDYAPPNRQKPAAKLSIIAEEVMRINTGPCKTRGLCNMP